MCDISRLKELKRLSEKNPNVFDLSLQEFGEKDLNLLSNYILKEKQKKDNLDISKSEISVVVKSSVCELAEILLVLKNYKESVLEITEQLEHELIKLEQELSYSNDEYDDNFVKSSEIIKCNISFNLDVHEKIKEFDEILSPINVLIPKVQEKVDTLCKIFKIEKK